MTDFYSLGRQLLAKTCLGEEFKPIDFASGTKNCKKGIPCGNSCISATKNCKGSVSPAGSAAAAWVQNNVPKTSPAAAAPATVPPAAQKTRKPRTPKAAAPTPTAAPATVPPPPPAVVPAAAPPPASVAAQKTRKPRTPKAAAPTPTAAPAAATQGPIKLNQVELDASRKKLIAKFGQQAVEAAERNVDKLMKDADIHIRVGSTDNLGKILGLAPGTDGAFKNAHQLGILTHSIPDLKGDYLTARARVEARTLGYDELSTRDDERPVYGYLGSKNPKDHSPNAIAYGSITLKMKSELKDRATFTGADSFKSGIASQVVGNGTPPPPNAASLAPTTRHGWDLTDKNFPSHYPSHYTDPNFQDASQRRAIVGAANAKSVEDIAAISAPTGNSYMETQIHGGTKATDIGEIHFSPKSHNDGPTQEVIDWAKQNNVPVFVNGKQIKNGKVPKKYQIAPPVAAGSAATGGPSKFPPPTTDFRAAVKYKAPTPPAHPKLKKGERVADMMAALDAGDFDTAINKIGPKIIAARNSMTITAANKHDPFMALMADDTGAAGAPRIASKAEIDDLWKNGGGHLLCRGVTDKDRAVDFVDGEYFVGNITMYGSGQYAVHGGKVTKGGPGVGYYAPTAAADVKKRFKILKDLSYVNKNSGNLRMALSADAKVTTQTKMLQEINDLEAKINTWASKEIAAIRKKNSGKNSSSLSDSDRAKNLVEEIDSKLVFGSNGETRSSLMTSPLAIKNYPRGIVRAMGLNVDQSDGLHIPLKGVAMGYTSTAANPPFVLVVVGKSGKPEINHPLNGTTYPDRSTFIDAALKVHAEKTVKDDKLAGAVTDPEQIAFEQQISDFKAMLYGDGWEPGTKKISRPSGRFAIARGYDGVFLDDSYEPDAFFVLYNRSKTLVQSELLDHKSPNGFN
ncbi:MAG TPA: hypothetical protein V6D27_00730 [Vampirovibrionales bacterium]